MPDERSLAALQTSHLKDDAYEAIRAALTDLTLPPGASISENWLVSQLGISKTPIRHALDASRTGRARAHNPIQGDLRCRHP